MTAASSYIFRNVRLLDPRWDEPRDGYEVLTEGNLIKDVSNGPMQSAAAPEVIRQATLVRAQVVQQEGRLGVLEPGAFADLIGVDGDRLRRLELLTSVASIPLVMARGNLHRNDLS